MIEEKQEKPEKHIRTINQVVKYLKEKDEETAVSYTAIKRAVDDKMIPSTKIGTRVLVVQEDVIDYFFNIKV